MRITTMPQMPLGVWGAVLETDSSSGMADRLTELGFFSGNPVQRQFSDRKGTLSAYRIADTCIALRRADAANVRVRIG